eukprot:8608112-Lingulodinium_polyedra.AAC.1
MVVLMRSSLQRLPYTSSGGADVDAGDYGGGGDVVAVVMVTAVVMVFPPESAHTADSSFNDAATIKTGY